MKPVAWACFAQNGNIRIWSDTHEEVQKVATQQGWEITPLYAGNTYFQAVDDALVCWEMTTTGNAKVDLNNLICMEQQVCLDPAVSLDARTLIRLGRLEALRECAEIVNSCAVKRHSARTACDIIRQTLAKEI